MEKKTEDRITTPKATNKKSKSQLFVSQQEKPQTSLGSWKKTSQEDVVFETFYHRSGREFQCMYLNGMRFYLDDWGSKVWQPFPKRWYQEGLLITNTVVKDAASEKPVAASDSGGQDSLTKESQSRDTGGDDREGVIKHPRKGKIPTYVFQRMHNVHCFYDHDSGQWMRMPIGYELHHEMVAKLVDQVQEELPNWNDRHDILSLLRQCNYDADECINTYRHLDDDEWLHAPKTCKEAKAKDLSKEKIDELEQTVNKLKIQLDEERRRREEAEKNMFSYCGPDFNEKKKLTEIVRETHRGDDTPVSTDLTDPSVNARLPISTYQDDNNPLILTTSPHVPVSPASVSSTSPSDLNVLGSFSDSDFIEHENINNDEHVKMPPIGPFQGERFLAPPSQFYTTNQTSNFFSLRQRALTTDIGYTGTVLPYGTAGVRKEERVLFPDGTVYHLTATWIPDPKLELISSSETQTEQEHTNFRNVETTQVSSQTDPTEDMFLLSLTSTNTF